jgi:hypothetical protein
MHSKSAVFEALPDFVRGERIALSALAFGNIKECARHSQEIVFMDAKKNAPVWIHFGAIVFGMVTAGQYRACRYRCCQGPTAVHQSPSVTAEAGQGFSQARMLA